MVFSSMTWFSDFSNRVSIGFSHSKRNNNVSHSTFTTTTKKKDSKSSPVLGILAFEAARTMSRLVSLYKSLSEEQIDKLRKEVLRSQGVAYLNSMDEAFLLKLACAERIEDLDRSAVTVSRFGKKCSDPGLNQFEFAYADLKLGFVDIAKLDSKGMEKSIEKMEKYISATSGLYAALESLSELEALERKTKRWKDHSGPMPIQITKQEFSEQKLSIQKQRVQHFKDASLWNQPFDRIVGFMARTVCVIYSRICVVFGPDISVLPNISTRHHRFSSLQNLDDHESVKKESVTWRSGPITTQKIKHIGVHPFRSTELKPVPGENIGFRIGLKENHESGFGWVEKTTRLYQQAPPTTVGGSGLALRYAMVIITLEKYLESPSSLTDSGREDLYQMLPESLKTGLSSKLKKLYKNQDDSEWWEDEALAQGWKDGLDVIMGWLGTMAHDTVKWINERSFEKYNFDAKPTVLLLQTLVFADKEKTEAAIVEIMVGLSFICRYEFNRPGYSQPLQRFDNTTDQQSLLVFKSHISSDPFGVLESWNSNTTFCNWTGVTCNITKQRVTGINLENLNLAGTISPHIANLSFLRVLNLPNNSFYGVLPTEFGRLFRLQFLVVNSNLIQGTIPSSLSSCTRLVTLDLMQNRFEGTIPNELSGLLQLQVLRLTDNLLTGQIPPSLQNLSSITNLLLSENNFQGSIPEELGHIPSLINLQIDQNNMTGKIPLSLLNSSSLMMLTLSINKLTGNLPADMFSKLTSLTTLFLGGNNLTGPIPLSIANASTLVRMDLSVFSLVSNRLTGKLPHSIGNLSRELSLLVMGNNQLEGSLPAEISNLVGLTMLSLEYNSFTGSIPPSLGELLILQNLYLHQNLFSGQIPPPLGNLAQLYEMSLSRNNLSGAIPASLGNFQRLQVLDLSVNKLHGTIPIEIIGIPSLGKVLNLSSNSLTGPIPIGIGQLKMVQGLDFSHNNLSGNIPASIGECSSLLVLDLSGNSFGGSIPNSLADLKGIEYIDLSVNNLSGRIPSSLQSLKFIQLLNLSINQLEGEVPKEGIFINSTVISLKGNPNLCGGVPLLGLANCIVSEKHSNGSKLRLILGVVAGFVACSVLLGLFLLLLWKRNTGEAKNNDDVISFEGPYRLYTYHDIRIATENFSSNNLIGEGSFGCVYKAILRDGTLAAIKVFNMMQHGALKSFLSECEALRNVRHRNLISILSACSNSNFKALVLHFMVNGSLEQWLYRPNTLEESDLNHRLNIAIDVASAMEYLHYDCETPVVHCDLKPSNILLDENMVAHVGDFGLARMLLKIPKEGSLSSTLGLKGSIGYIAPEYGMGRGVSPKGDVYSYGILLLELFTGKKPTDEMFVGELDLPKWVSMALPDRIMDIVDSALRGKGNSPEHCLITVIK
ncbi:hypothetical protein AQUCO_00900902v1, partial [Aquilegia coerulea]